MTADLHANCAHAAAPRTWSLVLTVLGVLWVLDDASKQIAPHPFLGLGAPLLGIVLLIDWCVRLASLGTANACAAPRRRGLWRWLVLPAALAVVASGLLTPWPMEWRFEGSRAALTRKARDVLGTGHDEGPQWVGLYRIETIRVHDGVVRFVTGTSACDPVGFQFGAAPAHSGWLSRRLDGSFSAMEW